MSDAIDRTHEQTEGAPDDHGGDDRAEDAVAGAADVLGLAAARLRLGATDVQFHEAATWPGETTLLAWGYFNPPGPTANRIDAVPVDGTGEILLVSASDHPMFPDYRAIALIPEGPDQPAAVREALAPIFAINGGRGEWGFVGSVPSYVHLIPNSPVEPACAAELLRSAIAYAGEADYGQEI